MKSITLIVCGFLALIIISCDKNSNRVEREDDLSNTTWIATLIDDNISTNPSGSSASNQYFPWQNCHLDDSYTFENGQVITNEKGTPCETGATLTEFNRQPYSYDSEKKRLLIGSGDNSLLLDVYELNKDRLKIGYEITTATGVGHIIYLFKRK